MSQTYDQLKIGTLDELFLGQVPGITPTIDSLVAGLSYVHLSLHTARPITLQTDSEITYGGYDRIQVARDGAGWLVSSINYDAKNVAGIQWPARTDVGTSTARYFGIGIKPIGGGSPQTLLYAGPLHAANMQWLQAGCNRTAGSVTVYAPSAGATDPAFVDPNEIAIDKIYQDPLPVTGINTAGTYFVKGAVGGVWPAPQTFQVAATSGGAALGLGTHESIFQLIKISPISVTLGVSPSIIAQGCKIQIA